MSDQFGIKRNVLKTTPRRLTALWLLGIFILTSSVFIGVHIGYALFGSLDNIMAYTFGFFFTLFTGSVIAWFTMALQENAQDIQIRVVQTK
jgi:hypothetical protein